MHIWMNERMNTFCDLFFLFIFFLPSAFNCELGMRKHRITPNTHIKTPWPWQIRTLSVCQRAKFTSSHALSGVANTFWLVLFKENKKGGGGWWKMLPCLLPLQISSRNPFYVSEVPTVWNLALNTDAPATHVHLRLYLSMLLFTGYARYCVSCETSEACVFSLGDFV